jgi:hypothetical protein
MKRIHSSIAFSVLALFALSMTLTACEDSLSVNPPLDVAEETALTSPDGVENALTGAYDLAQSSDLFAGDFQAAGDILSGAVEGTGPGNSLFEQNQLLARNIGVNNNAIVQGMWTNGYRVINAANRVERATSNIESFSEAEAERIRGEALFIRAAMYFELNRYWGHPDAVPDSSGGLGIPIVDPIDSANEAQAGTPRVSQQTLYEQVISDFLTAATLLDGKATGAGRATRTAALGYAARAAFYATGPGPNISELQISSPEGINLGTSDPNQIAHDLAAETITAAGGESALTDYTIESFGVEASSSEVLWAIQNTQEDNEGGVRGNYDFENNTELGVNPSYVNTWFLDSDSDELTSEDLAASNDERLLGRGSVGDDDYVRPLYIVSGGVPFTEKWGIRFMDVPVIRLAEMFLIRGETTLQGATGGPSAEEDLNTIRQRAGLSALSNATLDDFVAERARELAHENDYFHNLMRLERNIAGQSYGQILNRVTFPIPESETLTNPDIQQNPGYPRTGS